MIYSNFTDTELRRVIDNDPDCAPARDEAARRFLHARPEGDIWQEGYDEGHADGYDEGHADGYDAGCAEE